MRFDSSIFTKLRKDYAKVDSKREDVIRESRVVVKLSKQVIYSIHRGNLKEAEVGKKKMNSQLAKLRKLIGKSNLDSSGSMKAAYQEYVEAVCFYDLMKTGILPSSIKLKVNTENYLLGICDLSGELGRAAVHAAIKNDTKQFQDIKSLVNGLFGEMLKFNFRNSELRKKFDSIKYTVNKLEDMELDLAMRNKK